MIILVNDANILIDVLKTDLCSEFFELDYQFKVTDYVLDEVREGNINKLENFITTSNLEIVSFTAEEQYEIVKLVETYTKPSLPDCSCLYLAKKLGGKIITSEKPLRKAAQKENVQAHGFLWVLDQLLENEIISPKKACKKIKKLLATGSYQPKRECENRIKEWCD